MSLPMTPAPAGEPRRGYSLSPNSGSRPPTSALLSETPSQNHEAFVQPAPCINPLHGTFHRHRHEFRVQVPGSWPEQYAAFDRGGHSMTKRHSRHKPNFADVAVRESGQHGGEMYRTGNLAPPFNHTTGAAVRPSSKIGRLRE